MGQKNSKAEAASQPTAESLEQAQKLLFEADPQLLTLDSLAAPVQAISAQLQRERFFEQSEEGFRVSPLLLRMTHRGEYARSVRRMLEVLAGELRGLVAARVLALVPRERFSRCFALANLLIFLSDESMLQSINLLTVRTDLDPATREEVNRWAKEGAEVPQFPFEEVPAEELLETGKMLRLGMGLMIDLHLKLLTRSDYTLTIVDRLNQACFVLYCKLYFSGRHDFAKRERVENGKALVRIGAYFVGLGVEWKVSSVYELGVILVEAVVCRGEGVVEGKALPSHLFKSLPIVNNNEMDNWLAVALLFQLRHVTHDKKVFSRLNANRIPSLRLLESILKTVKTPTQQLTFMLEELCLQTKPSQIERVYVCALAAAYSAREKVDSEILRRFTEGRELTYNVKIMNRQKRVRAERLLLLGEEEVEVVLHRLHPAAHLLQLARRPRVAPLLPPRTALRRPLDARQPLRPHAHFIRLFAIECLFATGCLQLQGEIERDHSCGSMKSCGETSKTKSSSRSISRRQQKEESKSSSLWERSCSILPFRKSRQEKVTSKSPYVFSSFRFTPISRPRRRFRNIRTLRLTFGTVSFPCPFPLQRSAISAALLMPLPKNRRVLQRRKGSAMMTASSASQTSSPKSLMKPRSARKKAYLMGFLRRSVRRWRQEQRKSGSQASGERNCERMARLLSRTEGRRGRQAATAVKEPAVMSLLTMSRQLKQRKRCWLNSSTPPRTTSCSCPAASLLIATLLKFTARKGEQSPFSQSEGKTRARSQMRSRWRTKPRGSSSGMGRLLQKMVAQKVAFSRCSTSLPKRKRDISASQPASGPQHLISTSPSGSAQLSDTALSSSFTKNLWKQYWLCAIEFYHDPACKMRLQALLKLSPRKLARNFSSGSFEAFSWYFLYLPRRDSGGGAGGRGEERAGRCGRSSRVWMDSSRWEGEVEGEGEAACCGRGDSHCTEVSLRSKVLNFGCGSLRGSGGRCFTSNFSNFLGRRRVLSSCSRSSISLMLRCALYRLATGEPSWARLALQLLLEWIVFSRGSNYATSLLDRTEMFRSRVEATGEPGASSEPFRAGDSHSCVQVKRRGRLERQASLSSRKLLSSSSSLAEVASSSSSGCSFGDEKYLLFLLRKLSRTGEMIRKFLARPPSAAPRVRYSRHPRCAFSRRQVQLAGSVNSASTHRTSLSRWCSVALSASWCFSRKGSQDFEKRMNLRRRLRRRKWLSSSRRVSSRARVGEKQFWRRESTKKRSRSRSSSAWWRLASRSSSSEWHTSSTSRSVLPAFPSSSSTPRATRCSASALPCAASCSENAKDCPAAASSASAAAISENCESEASLVDSRKRPWKTASTLCSRQACVSRCVMRSRRPLLVADRSADSVNSACMCLIINKLNDVRKMAKERKLREGNKGISEQGAFREQRGLREKVYRGNKGNKGNTVNKLIKRVRYKEYIGNKLLKGVRHIGSKACREQGIQGVRHIGSKAYREQGIQGVRQQREQIRS